MSDIITVLLVDDSALTRKIMRSVLEQSSGIRVIGEASNGREAVALASELKPRIITMDIDMPEMGGLEAIEHIMALAPTRILVVSAKYEGRDSSFECLSRGALDILPKPTSHEAWPRLLTRVRELADIPVMPHFSALAHERRRKRRPYATSGSVEAVVVGASTGGPGTLAQIFHRLKSAVFPIFVVQHLSEQFSSSFIEWLGTRTSLPVREALPGPAEPGIVYVAVRGPHLVIRSSSNGVVMAHSHEAARQGHLPSIDVLFESAADSFGHRAVGVLLTGMGRDGAQGLKKLHDAGGHTLAQSEVSCTVYGMPKAAVELGGARQQLDPDEIAAELERQSSRGIL